MQFNEALHLAENGDLDAMHYVGRCLFTKYKSAGTERAVQEAIPWFQRAAQGGHVGSMFSIGVLLFNLYDGKGDMQKAVEQSLPWFRRASEKGHASAALQVISLGIVRMEVSRKTRDFNAVEDSAKAVIQASSLLQNSADAGTKAKVHDAREKALYSLALVMYARRQAPQAIPYLSKIGAFSDSCPMATVLWGLCEKDPRESYKLLKILERGVRSLLPPKADSLDELILSQAVLHMSVYYRTMDHDPDRAYALLSEGIAATKDPGCQKPLQEEQAHFRKKLLGGWQYAE